MGGSAKAIDAIKIVRSSHCYHHWIWRGFSGGSDGGSSPTHCAADARLTR